MKFDIFEVNTRIMLAYMFSVIGLVFIVIGVIHGVYNFILWGIVITSMALYLVHFNKKLKNGRN